MDKSEIAKLAHRMTGKDDLLALLNRIKQDEIWGVEPTGKFYPFTMKHINYYCNPNNLYRFNQFKIKKKTGGYRQITAPRNKNFTLLLRCVNEIFKSVYTPSNYAMGFAEGRSIVTNADAHKGQNYILNIDLKDFFPSIGQARVWKRLQIEPFNFSQPVANLLAGLCAVKEKRTMEDGTQKDVYVLPQGAPTSPVITNMICDTLDRRLAGLARRFSLRYTRYADDITFSSMHNVYQDGSEFNKELVRLIQGQGFTMNEKKTRLQKIGGRQEVTGVIVSSKLNVTQKYVRDIRNILYIWDRYGYAVAYAKFFPKYKEEKGHVKKNVPDLADVLGGKLMYLKMVKGGNDSVYKRLQAKFEKLTEKASKPMGDNSCAVTYLETTPLLEFEQKNNTEVVFVATKAHHYAYFMLDGEKILASINKAVGAEAEQKKEMLSMSLCRDKQGKPFWLVHLSTKKMASPPISIDIDQLNKELDILLNL